MQLYLERKAGRKEGGRRYNTHLVQQRRNRSEFKLQSLRPSPEAIILRIKSLKHKSSRQRLDVPEGHTNNSVVIRLQYPTSQLILTTTSPGPHFTLFSFLFSSLLVSSLSSPLLVEAPTKTTRTIGTPQSPSSTTELWWQQRWAHPSIPAALNKKNIYFLQNEWTNERMTYYPAYDCTSTYHDREWKEKKRKRKKQWEILSPSSVDGMSTSASP